VVQRRRSFEALLALTLLAAAGCSGGGGGHSGGPADGGVIGDGSAGGSGGSMRDGAPGGSGGSGGSGGDMGGAGGSAGGSGGGMGGAGGSGGACNPAEPEADCAGVAFAPCEPRVGTNGATLVRGTIVTPDRVICDGAVLFDRDSHKIACVNDQCDDQALARDASVVCADVVLPGLINPHDHMSYNTLPRWQHPGHLFTNHNQWDTQLAREIYGARPPADDPVAGRYNEMRLLMSGTTGVQKDVNTPSTADHVRNLDRGPDSNDLGYANDDLTECVTPLENSCSDAPRYPDMNVPARAYVAHVGEGTDAAAGNEFEQFDQQGQLGPKTTIIHCVACQGPQLTRVRTQGGHLIWSPQSNIDLYGVTTNVPVARAMGITVALGTDWTPSGDMNLLAEMKCAEHVSTRYWDGLLKPRDIVDMVTRDAAAVLGLDDLIGTLEPGRYADVLLLHGDRTHPYRAILDAKAVDVRGVFIGGVAYYGDVDVVDENNALNDLCETIDVCGQQNKRICVQEQAGRANAQQSGDWAKFRYQDHIDYLQALISSKSGSDGEFSYAYQLYPLFECEPTFACDLGTQHIPGNPHDGDQDGDGVPDDRDVCPRVFDPDQGDLDGDQAGDACDACPWGANVCPCNPPAGDDQDGDGVSDATDDCPERSNPDQADADGDHIGDACDACPDQADSPDHGCPTTIYAIKHGQHADDERLSVGGVVTAVDARGSFYLQVAEDAPDYAGADYSAVFVFLGGADMSVPRPHVGDSVLVTGSPFNYYDEWEIQHVSGVVVGDPHALPAPVVVAPADVADGGPRAAALEATRVRVENVTVTAQNPPAGPGEQDPTNAFVVNDALRVDDYLYMPPALPAVGTRFPAIEGILRHANGHDELEPRSADDFVQGPPRVAELRPGEATMRAGDQRAPLGADGTPLTVVLSANAGAGGEHVTIASSNEDAIPGTTVDVPAGQREALLMLHALQAADAVTLTASLPDRGQAQATVHVVAADAPPTSLTLSPAQTSTVPGGDVQLHVAVDLPAPAGGYTVTLAADPADGAQVPDSVFISPNSTGADVQVVAGMSPAEVHVNATLGELHAQATIDVQAVAGTGLVINEVDYDEDGVDTGEFVELYNPTAGPVSLDGLRLELVDGGSGRPYATFLLDRDLHDLPSHGLLVVADPAVMVPDGVPVVRMPATQNGNIQNGPDGIRLVGPSGNLDGVAYEGAVPNAGEGHNPAPADSSHGGVQAIGRCPDGADTDDNSADFHLIPATPGAPNTCP
jgi:hypothetical protein